MRVSKSRTDFQAVKENQDSDPDLQHQLENELERMNIDDIDKLNDDIVSNIKECMEAIYQKFELWAYGVVVSMFDFHRSDRGSNPGRGGKIS